MNQNNKAYLREVNQEIEKKGKKENNNDSNS